MNPVKLSLAFLLCLIPFALSAQRTISGRITDAEDGSPIIGASVFISNTTAGIATDAEGKYRFPIPGEGSYRLVISHVGYETVYKDIEPGKTSLVFDISMKMTTIDEVTITAKSSYSKKDVDLFWRTILGKKPSKKTIYATNPDDVYYYYNTETQILTVSCRVPLHIINLETGYQIQYVLKHFKYDYNLNQSSWEGQYMFTELEPVNIRQKNTWEKNRKKIYSVSIANFIRTLFHDSSLENGFLLACRKPGADRAFNLIDPEIFLSDGSDGGGKTLQIPYDDDLMLVCFGKPVTNKDILNARSQKPWEYIGLYRNIVRTPVVEPVQIFSDGTYRNVISFSPVFSSNSITGLNKILPVDYLPDIDKGSLTKIAVKESEQQLAHPLAMPIELNKVSAFIQALQNFSENTPQEKVYLHFDNTNYYQDDNIWFKCYVTSAQRQLSELSKTLYVELLNPGGEIIDKRILEIENGQCHGDFSLNHLPFYSGFYEVRAYTKYMLNFGEDVIFSRLLPVFDKPKTEGNFEEKKMLKYGRWGIRNYPIKRETPESGKTVNLRLFPEGGNLIQGVASKVAFEATDEAGNPIDVKGVVMDAAKQELCSITTLHEGRGVFSYTPAGDAGRRMKDIVEVEYSGKKYQFDLPACLPQGVVMEVDNTLYPDSILITLKKNSSTPAGILGIAVLNGGRLQTAYSAHLEEGEDELFLTIDKTQLPSGVTQIALFNSEGEILCDRLIFINMNELLNSELLDVKIKIGKQSYKPHELVDMEISVTDKETNPVSTTFSLSVRDGDNEVEYRQNILTDLLLMSEIKGYVRNPSYYFDVETGSLHLDLLLMVQGWRRYSLKQMAGIEPFEIKYLPEQGIEIHGNVVSFVKQKPQPKVDVSMLLMKKGNENEKGGSFIDSYNTDEQRSFSFVSNVRGKWSMILRATEKGKKKVDHRILLDRVFSPEPKQYRYADLQVSISEKDTEQINVEEIKDNDEDDSDTFLIAYRDSIAQLGNRENVNLIPEVVIKGKKNSKEQEIRRIRSTSVVYYDVTSEMDNFYDKGEYIGDDIHELMRSMNDKFYIRIRELKRPEPTLNVVYGFTEPTHHKILEYKHKMPLFIINYQPADFSAGEFDFIYYKYLTYRLDAIKSIYIDESIISICHYCIMPPMVSCVDKTDMFSCVVFIETYPEGHIPVKGAKGVRKTWLEGYSAVKEFYSPNYSELPLDLDYRRTLYWNPMVTTEEDGKAKIEFYNNSWCTNFSISAETVTAEGWIGVYTNKKNEYK